MLCQQCLARAATCSGKSARPTDSFPAPIVKPHTYRNYITLLPDEDNIQFHLVILIFLWIKNVGFTLT
jgi:hypothetical protein